MNPEGSGISSGKRYHRPRYMFFGVFAAVVLLHGLFPVASESLGLCMKSQYVEHPPFTKHTLPSLIVVKYYTPID